MKNLTQSAILDAIAMRIMARLGLGDDDTDMAVKAERETVKVATVLGDDTGEKRKAVKAESLEGGTTTTYVLQFRGKGDPDIQATPLAVFQAARKLAAKGKPIHEASLMAATGKPVNSIQSAIWWLRNHDASGSRVPASSKASLMRNA